MILGILFGIVTWVACGVAGGWLAKRDGWPTWLGVLIGLLAHVAGLAFLLIIRLVEWLDAKSKGKDEPFL